MSQYSVTAKDPKNEIIVAWNQSADSYIATVLSTEGSGEKSIVLSLKALKPQLLSIALVDSGYSEAISKETMFSLWSDRDGVAF